MINTVEEQTGIDEIIGQVRLSGGAQAVAARTPKGETLQIRSQHGEVLFEYDATTGKSRILVPTGDLEIAASDGNIDLLSSKKIRLVATESVEVSTQGRIHLESASPASTQDASVELQLGEVKIAGERTSLAARYGKFAIEQTQYKGSRFEGEIGFTSLASHHVEMTIGRIVSWAKSAYRTVTGLSQLRTGRMRTLVDTSCHIKAEKTYLKAEKDFKIDGESIYMG